MYDERWRIVATYRGSDSEPKEQFVHHAAGDSGFGTASYIDDVILRDRDDNSGWTSSADGTLEERIYHCQNWRHDVVALIDATGAQVEMVRYSPYGVPFGLPAGDLDSDGDVDAADLTVFDALIAYDARADLDLDGDYDATDRSTINANRGTSAGLGVLSESGVASRKGYGGHEADPSVTSIVFGRARVYSLALGQWIQRDPAGHVDGPNTYQYIQCNLLNLDPCGTHSIAITPNGPCYMGKCGSVFRRVEIAVTLDQTPCPFPVVAQKLSIFRHSQNCCKSPAVDDVHVAYELMFPYKTNTLEQMDDQWGWNACSCATGHHLLVGQVRLFCFDALEDRSDFLQAFWSVHYLNLSCGSCGDAPEPIGTNHADTDEPIGWEEFSAQTMQTLAVTWDCCPDDTDTNLLWSAPQCEIAYE